jgi:predicted ABC-class ATPase
LRLNTKGDGRERVVTDPLAIKIRAEDGRAVTAVDISPFITNLPFGRATTEFSSADASGSTSQAAAIVEALEAGATTLLIDEDTTATNFMIRDARMQALVAADKEPIKPFISRVRTVRVFSTEIYTLEDAIGSYACSLEARLKLLQACDQ